MRNFLTPLLALTLVTSPALAQDVVGPQTVTKSDAFADCRQGQDDPAFWACLAAAGVPPAGLDFARATIEAPMMGSVGVVTGFTELGIVDLAEVDFTFLANTNHQQVLVNGDFGDGFAALPLVEMTWPEPPADAGTQALLAAFAQALPSARMAVTGHRALDGGRQTFVFSDVVTDGCRACAVVGAALYRADFDQGALTGQTALGWYPEALMDPAMLAAAVMRGDTLAMKVALTQRGLAPGAMDGVATPALQSALEAFARETCLAPDDTLAILQALSAPGPHLLAPPCAN